MIFFSTTGQYSEIQFSNASFQVISVMHPSTYLNKILFGSKQGELQLWNIKSNKMIYSFPGWGEPVTVLQQVGFTLKVFNWNDPYQYRHIIFVNMSV